MRAVKHLIPSPYLSQDPFDPREQFPQDVQQLVTAAYNQGYQLSPIHATELWVRHSEDYCAGWLEVRGSKDEDLVRVLLQYATVVDGPGPSAPPPPDGYATWLDYAVDTMDTRSPQLDQMLQENAPEHSRESMRQAVQAELAQLRWLAGFGDREK
jgi:hypothetical protein